MHFKINQRDMVGILFWNNYKNNAKNFPIYMRHQQGFSRCLQWGVLGSLTMALQWNNTLFKLSELLVNMHVLEPEWTFISWCAFAEKRNKAQVHWGKDSEQHLNLHKHLPWRQAKQDSSWVFKSSLPEYADTAVILDSPPLPAYLCCQYEAADEL